MTEWDPYYLRRGIRKLSEEYKRRAAREVQQTREREEHRDAKADINDGLADSLISAHLESQRIEVERRLEEMRTANTQALLQNAIDIEAAQERIRNILARAAVLPDGRRVFLTVDGRQVFDEHGQEVSPEEIEASSIPDDAPRWEELQHQRKGVEDLHRERDKLIEQQKKLDEAEQRHESGELTGGELDALEAEFGNADATVGEGEPAVDRQQQSFRADLRGSRQHVGNHLPTSLGRG